MISTFQSPNSSKTASTFKNKTRVLIACEDGEVGDGLVEVLKTTSLKAERAVDFTSACKLLKTGKFQVVFATPRVSGGSWEKLLDFAHSKAQALSFVIVARSFDLNDWGNCLKNGAFEVLDSACEISRAGEVAMHAISATWAMAGHESTQPGILELNDLSTFSSNCSKAET
jgi:DNA-binding NtrC family response regulator